MRVGILFLRINDAHMIGEKSIIEFDYATFFTAGKSCMQVLLLKKIILVMIAFVFTKFV